MVRELGLQMNQYRTREDDGLGELQLQAIADAVEQCRFTVLVASSAARWNKLAQLAAALAQHAGLESDVPRLLNLARDFELTAPAELGLAEFVAGKFDTPHVRTASARKKCGVGRQP